MFEELELLFFKPVTNVEIGGQIGGGLRINHNNTVVFTYKMGKNVTIGPNVLIGKGPLKDNGDGKSRKKISEIIILKNIMKWQS